MIVREGMVYCTCRNCATVVHPQERRSIFLSDEGGLGTSGKLLLECECGGRGQSP